MVSSDLGRLGHTTPINKVPKCMKQNDDQTECITATVYQANRFDGYRLLS